MGQILHCSATATHAVRVAIHRSKAKARELAERHGLDPKIVAKSRKCDFVEDAPMGISWREQYGSDFRFVSRLR
jgi:hypothetical protein